MCVWVYLREIVLYILDKNTHIFPVSFMFNCKEMCSVYLFKDTE